MRIGLYRPGKLHNSIGHYIDNVVSEFETLGVKPVFFSKTQPLPRDVDLYWDPGTGRGGPHLRFIHAPYPLVVTFHGAANLVLPIRECFGSGLRSLPTALKSRAITKAQWALNKNRCAATITVSDYAKGEVIEVLRQSEDKVFSIYHGVDLNVFHPNDEVLNTTTTPYFLHVSQGQPVKNVGRIVTAYSQLNHSSPLEFKLVAPGYSIPNPPEGIQLYHNLMAHAELARIIHAVV